MNKKRIAALVAAVAVVVVISSLVAIRKMLFLFAPNVYGLHAALFTEPERAVAPVSTVVQQQARRSRPPNIIVILADDLGYGDVGIHGGGVIQTPHMDALAGEGAHFTSFYAAAPVCSPSRAGLLTGRYPLRSGIVGPLQASQDTFARKATRRAGALMAQLGVVDMPGGGSMVSGLPESEITIAEALKVADYQTAAIGKWHLGDFTTQPAYHPFNHGFDYFVGFNASNDDWPVAFWRGDKEIIADIGIDQAPYTRLFTEEAVHFIEQAGERPFFLYLAHKDPHQPFYPSEAFSGASDGGPYGDAVSEFDWSVGEITACVKRLDIQANTLIIVTSDNGPWYEGSAGGLRGRKGQSYEGGFRVPCIAWWPDNIPAGHVVNEPAMNIDFLPTFLSLADVPLPGDRIIDGADIFPLLTGAGTLGGRPLFFSHDYDVEAVRSGDWKYVHANSHYTWPLPLDKEDNIAGQLAAGNNYHPPDSDETIPALGSWPALYNLTVDPGEAYNVAKRHPDIAQKLQRQLEKWKAAYYANPRGWKQ
ncbi:MAG TPA: hypothetical protein ENN29_03675 [Candidatus Hydrogenedentes bacterium]|nr:hypothetical protein [Candidatus Hydrogenedentota bacterium]